MTMTTGRIRVLVAEDQPVACEKLCGLLATEPDIDIVGVCHDGPETVEAIESLRPDLVFLDIEMPEFDGLRVIGKVRRECMPAVIFVTAYDDYALEAFDMHAVDYLLKPFARERFQRALTYARRRLAQPEPGALADSVVALMDRLGRTPPRPSRLIVRSNGRIVFVSPAEIDWIESEGNYVRLRVGQESHLMRETMAGMETKLGAERFCRIHRGRIVNLERVRELRVTPGGEYEVVLKTGARLALGRAYRERLRERLRSAV